MSNCRSCTQPILWFKTRNNKNVPVDVTEQAQADHAAKVVFNPKEHTAHFETCPNADQHRARK